nr:MAG TPA: hypothetical protein [Caudoviricetes sp.]DAI58407.1 MAG TPA: hypothetical protein [Crassvirales sp.]DAJ78501.1 MAG TPA: hypothetical protein [Crassvirales sp.]DAU06265.1 MAG TPA: hypothetical protein [Caudoviricetes sp.]
MSRWNNTTFIQRSQTIWSTFAVYKLLYFTIKFRRISYKYPTTLLSVVSSWL